MAFVLRIQGKYNHHGDRISILSFLYTSTAGLQSKRTLIPNRTAKSRYPTANSGLKRNKQKIINLRNNCVFFTDNRLLTITLHVIRLLVHQFCTFAEYF